MQLVDNVLSLVLLMIVSCHGQLNIGRQMGVVNLCDDGKTGLEIDWDGNYDVYTCPTDSWLANQTIPLNYYAIPGLNPQTDKVRHYCVQDQIHYNNSPPLRGPHRPVWAKYGEYLYLPPQRWLHNLEHGSVVMLYHPCADKTQIDQLRKVLTNCMFRHVITPYNLLTKEQPLALIAWGAKLEMNVVDKIQAEKFIQKHARSGPEDIGRDGFYDLFLLKHAEFVSDSEDSNLCPRSIAKDLQTPRKKRNVFLSAEKRLRPMDMPLSAYDRVYLQQLQQFNGPKFASDVLPPTALLEQYKSPHYVMAGSFLGADPQNPQTMTNGNSPTKADLQLLYGSVTPTVNHALVGNQAAHSNAHAPSSAVTQGVNRFATVNLGHLAAFQQPVQTQQFQAEHKQLQLNLQPSHHNQLINTLATHNIPIAANGQKNRPLQGNLPPIRVLSADSTGSGHSSMKLNQLLRAQLHNNVPVANKPVQSQTIKTLSPPNNEQNRREKLRKVLLQFVIGEMINGHHRPHSTM